MVIGWSTDQHRIACVDSTLTCRVGRGYLYISASKRLWCWTPVHDCTSLSVKKLILANNTSNILMDRTIGSTEQHGIQSEVNAWSDRDSWRTSVVEATRTELSLSLAWESD